MITKLKWFYVITNGTFSLIFNFQKLITIIKNFFLFLFIIISDLLTECSIDYKVKTLLCDCIVKTLLCDYKVKTLLCDYKVKRFLCDYKRNF